MTDSSEKRIRFGKSFVLAMTIAYAIAFLAMLSGFFEALLMAAILSGIFYPFYRNLKASFGDRATPASLVTILAVLAIIVVPAVILLGLVADQAVGVAESARPWFDEQLARATDEKQLTTGWTWLDETLGPYHEEVTAKLAELTAALGVVLANGLTRLAEGAFTFFFDLFVMLYAMFVFLVRGPAIIEAIMRLFPIADADKERMLQVAHSVSRATIKGTLIIGGIQGALGGVGFAVAGIDNAVFWAAVMAVLSVLPGIGATLVWAPAVIFLLASGQTVAGLGLLVWSAGVVATIDNVLRPILVGRDTELPDLLVFLSTLGGLALFGATGLVIGPILAALFLTVLSIYSRVFADSLNVDQSPADPSSERAGVQLGETP